MEVFSPWVGMWGPSSLWEANGQERDTRPEPADPGHSSCQPPCKARKIYSDKYLLHMILQLVDLFTLLDSGIPRGREAAPAGAAA